MKKIAKIVLTIYTILGGIVAIAFISMSIFLGLNRHIEKQSNEISIETGNTKLGIIGYYSSWGHPIGISNFFDNSGQCYSKDVFLEKNAGNWILRIPPMACSACIDEVIHTIREHAINGKGIAILAHAKNVREANIFVLKYKLKGARCYFTSDTLLANTSLENNSNIYFFRLNENSYIYSIIEPEKIDKQLYFNFLKHMNNEA